MSQCSPTETRERQKVCCARLFSFPGQDNPFRLGCYGPLQNSRVTRLPHVFAAAAVSVRTAPKLVLAPGALTFVFFWVFFGKFRAYWLA